MRLGSIQHHTVYEGEGVGMILGLELIREEWHANGMIPMGVNNMAAIVATHSIKPGPGHYLWDLFHWQLQMVTNKHQDMDLLVWGGHLGTVTLKGTRRPIRKPRQQPSMNSVQIKSSHCSYEKCCHAANQLFNRCTTMWCTVQPTRMHNERWYEQEAEMPKAYPNCLWNPLYSLIYSDSLATVDACNLSSEKFPTSQHYNATMPIHSYSPLIYIFYSDQALCLLLHVGSLLWVLQCDAHSWCEEFSFYHGQLYRQSITVVLLSTIWIATKDNKWGFQKKKKLLVSFN